jgi:hypothetical protein
MMADRARGWVAADAGILVDDRTTAPWTAADYQHGLLFKYSPLSHNDVPRNDLQPLLSTSKLPAKNP